MTEVAFCRILFITGILREKSNRFIILLLCVYAVPFLLAHQLVDSTELSI